MIVHSENLRTSLDNGMPLSTVSSRKRSVLNLEGDISKDISNLLLHFGYPRSSLSFTGHSTWTREGEQLKRLVITAEKRIPEYLSQSSGELSQKNARADDLIWKRSKTCSTREPRQSRSPSPISASGSVTTRPLRNMNYSTPNREIGSPRFSFSGENPVQERLDGLWSPQMSPLSSSCQDPLMGLFGGMDTSQSSIPQFY